MYRTLKHKRPKVNGWTAAYMAQIAQVKDDLAHINASIWLFSGPDRQRVTYVVSKGFFMKGEIADLCGCHIRSGGELSTRDLAERGVVERNLEVTDTTLSNSVVFNVVQPQGHATLRKLVCVVKKRKGIGQGLGRSVLTIGTPHFGTDWSTLHAFKPVGWTPMKELDPVELRGK